MWIACEAGYAIRFISQNPRWINFGSEAEGGEGELDACRTVE